MQSLYRRKETGNTDIRLSAHEINTQKKAILKAFLPSFLQTIKPLILLTPPAWLLVQSTLNAWETVLLSGELNSCDIKLTLIRAILNRLDVTMKSPPFPMIITQSEERWTEILTNIELASFTMCSIFTAQSTALYFGNFVNLSSGASLSWLPSMVQLLICSQLQLTVAACEQTELGIVDAIRTNAPTMNLAMRISQWKFLQEDDLLKKIVHRLLDIPTISNVVEKPQTLPAPAPIHQRRYRRSTRSTASSSEEDSTSAEEQSTRGRTGTSSTTVTGTQLKTSSKCYIVAVVTRSHIRYDVDLQWAL